MKEKDKNKYELYSENFFQTPSKFKLITSPYHLNNYDSTILEDRAYLQMENQSLKFEYQITNLEESIAILADEIFSAIDLCDIDRANRLSDKKERLEEELGNLIKKYNELGFSSKISGFVGTAFKVKSKTQKTFLQKISFFIRKYFFTKISKRMNFTFNIKSSLERLSNINRSVDELISLQVPFGEAFDRYEKLTSYINRANEIHFEILDNLKIIENPQKNKPDKILDITR